MPSITASPAAVTQEVIVFNPWANDTNVFASDDARTTCTQSAGGTTDALIVTDCDFDALPVDATITGYEILVEWSTDNFDGNIGNDIYVEIRHDGATVGTGKDEFPNLSTTDIVTTVGGAADLWGASLTVAQIKDGTFGARIVMSDTFGIEGYQLRIDHIQIRVHYTEAGGGGSAGARRRRILI